SWVLPGGEDCSDCKPGPCWDRSTDLKHQSTLQSTEVEDCHTCCTIKACEQDDNPDPTYMGSGFEVQVADIPTEVTLLLPKPVVLGGVHIHVRASYPNAPPLARQTRAPPTRLS
ncbi:MAG: hypothetical protein AB7V39_16410, partial [Nitrospiraceae bacterium]